MFIENIFLFISLIIDLLYLLSQGHRHQHQFLLERVLIRAYLHLGILLAYQAFLLLRGHHQQLGILSS